MHMLQLLSLWAYFHGPSFKATSSTILNPALQENKRPCLVIYFAITHIVFIHIITGLMTITRHCIDEFISKHLSIDGLVYDE